MIKLIIVYIFDILSILINYYNSSKVIKNYDKFYLLLDKPIGLGDIMMLSPFILSLNEHCNFKLNVISTYNNFLNFNVQNWKSFESYEKDDFKNSILISPNLNLKKIHILFYFKNYIGYFFSNRLVSSFGIGKKIKVNHKMHYLDRTLMINKILGIKSITDYPYIVSSIKKNYALINITNNWEEREYPFEFFAEVLANINLNVKLILVGDSSEKSLKASKRILELLYDYNIVNLVGKTTIDQLKILLIHSKFYLGSDSGLTHLAILCSTPVYAIFGCVPSNLRLPLKKNSYIRIFESDNVCMFRSCYNGLAKPICRNNLICLKSIEPKLIYNEINKKICAE